VIYTYNLWSSGVINISGIATDSGLYSFKLQDNNLSGQFPFGDLPIKNLRYFIIDHNQFTGLSVLYLHLLSLLETSSPYWYKGSPYLFRDNNMQIIKLQFNNFYGTVNQLFNLSNFMSLINVTGNDFSGFFFFLQFSICFVIITFLVSCSNNIRIREFWKFRKSHNRFYRHQYTLWPVYLQKGIISVGWPDEIDLYRSNRLWIHM